MDATASSPALSAAETGTAPLVRRLWREYIRRYRAKLLLILLATAIMAVTQALYPVLIDHAVDMFEAKDRRILYQVPALVIGLTGFKALSQYFQNVLVQQVVLQTIRELQGRMSGEARRQRRDHERHQQADQRGDAHRQARDQQAEEGAA